MANRVVMDAGRISVSAPGFDVLSASAANMIFDSRSAEYGAVFMTGQATGYSITIPFGRTLPRVPVVWAAGRSGGTWHQLGWIESTDFSAQGIDAGATNTAAYIDNVSGYDLVRYVVFTIGT
ncbi:hypothetical protein D3C72_275730 [compost metagenome]